MVPVTPSFFRLLSRSTTHTAERRSYKKGRDASPCPFRTLTASSWLTSLAGEFEHTPLAPNRGCAGNPSFPLPDLSIAVLVASCAARSPLRATPASASVLRDLLTAVAPSKGVSIFCVRYSVRSFLAPSNNLKDTEHVYKQLYIQHLCPSALSQRGNSTKGNYVGAV